MIINNYVPNSNIFNQDITKAPNSLGITKTQSSDDNSTGNGGLSFLDTLKQQLDQVNNQQVQANVLTDQMVNGGDVDVHQVMLSTEEAKMSLDLAVQVRNKLLDAYQEINRIQL